MVANTMPKENMRPLQWRDIDPAHMHTLWRIHTETPLAVRCRNYVLDHLFSSELEVLNGNGEVQGFDPSFTAFFQRRFREFCFDAYDMYMVLGFVPVVLVQHANGHFYPCVPKYGSFRLQSAYAIDAERMYFRVLRPKALKVYRDDEEEDGTAASARNAVNRMRENLIIRTAGMSNAPLSDTFGLNGISGTGGPIVEEASGVFGTGDSGWIFDKTVSVITGLGSDPGINGEIRSPLASVVSEIVMTSSLARYMLVSEYRMTHPPLTMQFHKTEDPDNYDAYRPLARGGIYNPDDTFSLESQTVDATDTQLRAIKAHLAHRAREDAHNMGVQEQAMTERDSRRAQVGEGTICVPKGLEYVKNDSNVTQAGNKYMPQKLLTDDHVSGLYGIPLPLLRNAGALRGNIAGQNEIFRNTLIKYAKMLGDIATAAFMEIYSRDNGRYYEALFGRKAVVDDSMFVKHGIDEARRSGLEIIPDDTGRLAPPPPLKNITMGDANQKGEIRNDSTGETAEDISAEIKRILAANEREAARKTAKQTKKKKEEKHGKLRNKHRKYAPPPDEKVAVDLRANDSGATGFYVKINVTHLMNDKMIQHLFDIGAITLHAYQNMMLSRNGFSSMQFKKPPTTTETMIGALLRDPSSAAPREDSYQPEGIGLREFAGQKRRIVPPGILLDLARHGGDVDKMEAEKKEQENAEHAQAKRAIKKRRMAEPDSDSSDDDVPAKKPAKKSKGKTDGE